MSQYLFRRVNKCHLFGYKIWISKYWIKIKFTYWYGLSNVNFPLPRSLDRDRRFRSRDLERRRRSRERDRFFLSRERDLFFRSRDRERFLRLRSRDPDRFRSSFLLK